MKQLLERTENFGTSRPVFRLTMDDDKRTISMNQRDPLEKYSPTPVEGDLLSELVCDYYTESFNIHQGEFAVDKYDVAQQAMNKIYNMLPSFLEKNMELKNPRQSKLYRWYYRSQPKQHEDYNDGIVMLYKYIRSFADDDMKASDTKHIKNAIAVMEAIMESYEKE